MNTPRKTHFAGIDIWRGYLSSTAQSQIFEQINQAICIAPLFQPTMPRTGKPFSVRMTNMGPLGWVSDKSGYRYQETHPVTNRRWPDIPQSLLDIWNEVCSYPAPPQACLVNIYDKIEARMGLHVDNDEDDMTAPIVSISLGDSAVFRIGGLKRSDATQKIELRSGDVVVMAGDARFYYHGIDAIKWGTSTLLPDGGRINLTLRRVAAPS